MGLFWEIMYVVVTVLCTAVLPFAIFYYEVRLRFFLMESSCTFSLTYPTYDPPTHTTRTCTRATTG